MEAPEPPGADASVSTSASAANCCSPPSRNSQALRVSSVSTALQQRSTDDAYVRRAHAITAETQRLANGVQKVQDKLAIEQLRDLEEFANEHPDYVDTLWDRLAKEDWAGQIAVFLDQVTNGASTEVLTSEAFGKALDAADGFFAGWSDALTVGLTTRARGWLWGDSATRNHQGFWFTLGNLVGTAHTMALGFSNPCSAGVWTGRALRVFDAVQFVGDGVNAVDNFSRGNYFWGALDSLSALAGVSGLLSACFASGTPLLTPEGSKPIEQFQVGDLVLARPEHDPSALVEPRRVEEVFVRTGKILNLHVAGQIIRTTAEHPFWVTDKGWLPTSDLQVGDLLSTRENQWVEVEGVADTGEYTQVYNLRIEQYRTYFVGCDQWGRSRGDPSNGNNIRNTVARNLREGTGILDARCNARIMAAVACVALAGAYQQW